MELKDLIGEHYLSGVDLYSQKIKRYGYTDTAEVVRFVLDDKTYKAIEDPDDGYRSYLGELEITDEKISNNFPAQRVIGVMRPNDTYSNNNTIEFIDVITNKLVLAVGTDNFDDYYPVCVFEWNPQNLAINIGK